MTQTDARNAPSSSTGRSNGRRRPARDDLKVLVYFLILVLGVETLALVIWAIAIWGTQGWLSAFAVLGVAAICSGAASLSGGLLGFLFGIPRSTETTVRTHLDGSLPQQAITSGDAAASTTASAGPSSAAGRPPLRVNTNLEDISDGITKVLLGAGLAQASAIITGAGRLADFLGPSFGPGSAGKAVAIATIIYGALEGFFAGYLTTRLYLTAAFGRADPHDVEPT